MLHESTLHDQRDILSCCSDCFLTASFSALQHLPQKTWRQMTASLTCALYVTQCFYPFIKLINKLLRFTSTRKSVSEKNCVVSLNYYWFVYAIYLTNLLHLLWKDLEIHSKGFFFNHTPRHCELWLTTSVNSVRVNTGSIWLQRTITLPVLYWETSSNTFVWLL